MDAVTYPHDSVIATIENGFVPFAIDMLGRHPDFKEACAGGRVMWGPTLIVADSRGREVRRWVGWLPPSSFVAELAFCRAMAEQNSGNFAEALAAFNEIVDRDTATAIHPEALYWQGIAGFLAANKDMSALKRSWTRLVADYPGNRFATHASVIEEQMGQAPYRDE